MDEKKENGCNGYTNNETRLVSLWLSNEQETYGYWREIARETMKAVINLPQVEAGTWSKERAARFELADRLKDEVLNGSPRSATATVYSDLLTAALSRVNWEEIAQIWLAQIT